TEWLPWIEGWEREGISITDACAALLWTLAALAPLHLVVHSGGKSLHGWFKFQGATESQLDRFKSKALTLGACSSTLSTPSQFVRMPDGTRDNGNRQLVWFFDPPTF